MNMDRTAGISTNQYSTTGTHVHEASPFYNTNAVSATPIDKVIDV